MRHRELLRLKVARVRTPDYSQRRLVGLDEIYVQSPLTTLNGEVDLVQVLREGSPGGTVILGDPGGGKTTLMKWLALRASDVYEVRTVLLITLREFESQREREPCSVAQFAEAHAREWLQCQMSTDQWEYAFRRGWVAVLFDGLDELVSVTRREEMTQIIEGFVHAFPSVPVVVTCRKVGYSEARLPDDLFEVVTLGGFTEPQVSEYCEKWFSLFADEMSDSFPSAQKATDSFLAQSRSAEDLRRNPLLLSLLCILFRGEESIPGNLAEIYRRCTELLFEKWDAARGIPVPMSGERLRLLLQRIAWWLYQQRLNEVGVREGALVSKCAEELMELKDPDPHHARELAREFVDYCRGRAWVFSDAGSSDLVERRYCFTHRTFMEYLVACHLGSEAAQTKDVDPLLEIALTGGEPLIGVMALQSLGPSVDAVIRTLLAEVQRMNRSDRLAAMDFLQLVLRYVDLHNEGAMAISRLVLGEAFGDALRWEAHCMSSWRSTKTTDRLAR